MGFLKPKVPKPPPLPAPPKADEDALREERALRAKKSGRSSTLISDLGNQTEDIDVQSRISKLLG